MMQYLPAVQFNERPAGASRARASASSAVIDQPLDDASELSGGGDAEGPDLHLLRSTASSKVTCTTTSPSALVAHLITS